MLDKSAMILFDYLFCGHTMLSPTALKQEERNALRGRLQALRAWNLGLTMAVGMGLFTALGWGVDHYRGKGKTGILIGAGLGIVYMVYELWRMARVEPAVLAGKDEPPAPQPPVKTMGGGTPV